MLGTHERITYLEEKKKALTLGGKFLRELSLLSYNWRMRVFLKRDYEFIRFPPPNTLSKFTVCYLFPLFSSAVNLDLFMDFCFLHKFRFWVISPVTKSIIIQQFELLMMSCFLLSCRLQILKQNNL